MSENKKAVPTIEEILEMCRKSRTEIICDQWGDKNEWDRGLDAGCIAGITEVENFILDYKPKNDDE